MLSSISRFVVTVIAASALLYGCNPVKAAATDCRSQTYLAEFRLSGAAISPVEAAAPVTALSDTAPPLFRGAIPPGRTRGLGAFSREGT